MRFSQKHLKNRAEKRGIFAKKMDFSHKILKIKQKKRIFAEFLIFLMMKFIKKRLRKIQLDTF